MARFSHIKAVLAGLFQRPVHAPDAQAWWDDDGEDESRLRDAEVVEIIVDDRRFLLGLDELYRAAVKRHEQGELLACAQRVANAMNVVPADVPVEGYYSEHPDLTTYFQLLRAFQKVPLERACEVESLQQFQRLLAVTSSPIYGSPVRKYLLPKGRDPFSAALRAASSAEEFTVPLLTASAAQIASDTDDYSLVGLACRVKDPVVVTALRESVVLYAEDVTLGLYRPVRRNYVWRVDPDLSAVAQRFVDTFNALFGRELPPVNEKYAHVFGRAADEDAIFGRCVRLGQTPAPDPRFYHWAIAAESDGQLTVDAFWAPEIWSTDRYRRLHARRRPGVR